jgi:hypothetical protein
MLGHRIVDPPIVADGRLTMSARDIPMSIGPMPEPGRTSNVVMPAA